MTEDNMESQQNEFGDLVLPENGVTDLTDKLTEYMTEIELGGVPDILGQVLDDFIDQAGGMPEDLRDEISFDQITSNQLAVTLAYQLCRLECRSQQIVLKLIEKAIQKWEGRPVTDSPDISEGDLRRPEELVYPRLRRMEYANVEDEDEFYD